MRISSLVLTFRVSCSIGIEVSMVAVLGGD